MSGASRILAGFLIAAAAFSGCRGPSERRIAAGLLRETLRLDRADILRITSLTDQTEMVKAVKFQVNGVPAVSRMVRYRGGWQIEDVGGPAGIWGGPPLPPRFDPAEKNAVAQREILDIAAALEHYARFKGEFEFAYAGPLEESSDVYAALCPHFAIRLPVRDPWGYPYVFLYGKAIGRTYGLASRSPLDYLVASLGRDGRWERWTYASAEPRAGLEAVWNPDHDIVCYNGEWIRGTPVRPALNGRRGRETPRGRR